MDKEITFYDLEKEVREAVREAREDLLNSEYPEDLILEIVDAAIPIYNSDLLAVAIDNSDLAVEEPEVFAFGGKHTAINAIAGRLFEKLYGTAMEEWQAIKELVEIEAENK